MRHIELFDLQEIIYYLNYVELVVFQILNIFHLIR